uniref:Uncharacterized protein n=1 Tax=Helianthus annuus TaxID=4232 RepID=A0A251VB63_HELAN
MYPFEKHNKLQGGVNAIFSSLNKNRNSSQVNHKRRIRRASERRKKVSQSSFPVLSTK